MNSGNSVSPGRDESATVLLTGASGGIGRAIALNLARMGNQLFLLGRDADALQALSKECAASDGSAGYLAGDLRDKTYMHEAMAEARRVYTQIDILINNAGVSDHAPVYAADMAVWEDILDVNFNAAVYLSRHILPEMIERKAGAVINISSISGRHTVAGSAIYAASKHAINGFTGCLYEDVREFGIKVSSIMPGFVDTGLTANMRFDAEKMIRPDDVAAAVAYVLSSGPTCCPTEIVIRPQLRP